MDHVGLSNVNFSVTSTMPGAAGITTRLAMPVVLKLKCGKGTEAEADVLAPKVGDKEALSYELRCIPTK